MTLPTLGWTVLSRDALRRAEAQLQEDTQDVRDEIGFLNLHQAYANRFFPGTTVLQTRLRYILFVPWMYHTIASNRSLNIGQAIQEEEINLVKRLRYIGERNGVIGARSYPKPTSQPASLVYWTALQAWNILRKLPNGSSPSRMQVHHFLQRARPFTTIQDDDRQPLEKRHSLFINLPDPPKNWHIASTQLDFDLTTEEALWIRDLLIGVTKNNLVNEQPSVLSILAESNIPLKEVTNPWSREVLDILCTEECQVVERAGQVAALVAIGRAAYNAMVELMRNKVDQLPITTVYGDFLHELAQGEYAEQALQADVHQVGLDAVHLRDHPILDVLMETQEWLRNPQSIERLLELYRRVEISRKERRSQLADNLAGQQRRAEWIPEEKPQSFPLNYRWGNVKRLLGDLKAAL